MLQKTQMCIDKFVTIHALLVKKDTVGFSAHLNGLLDASVFVGWKQ